MGSPRYHVSLGIGDIDSYNILFYAHYLRYCERAANACYPSGGRTHATLLRAELVKYSSSVAWNDAVEVRSTLVPRDEPVAGEVTLLHEWTVGGKTVHVCLATYSVDGDECPSNARMVPSADEKLRRRELMRISALQREAGQIAEYDTGRYRRERCEVMPDMRSAAGGLNLPTILDLMERQRTEIIGGQAELERLKACDGVRIVVYSMQGFQLHNTPVAAREVVEYSSGVAMQNDGMFYCLHQRVVAPRGPVSEAHVKLVFVKDSAVVRAPERVLQRIAAEVGAA